MKYLAAIQARCGSSRLPGKIHMELNGKPALQRVIERAAMSEELDEVAVITSFAPDDVKTVRLVSSLGYRVFAGSEEDVLDRYYQCAKLVRPLYVVRITGDCPLFDPRLLDDAIRKMSPDSDYMAAMTETLGDGLDLEIIRFTALEKAWREARMASEREHVTLYIKNRPSEFCLQNYTSPIPNLQNERWTLDEAEDYKLLSAIFDHFGEEPFFARDVVEFLDSHPELRGINAKIARNEGLAKSLLNDHEVAPGGAV